MAKAKFILVKESEQELKLLMRKQPVHLKNRIQMLLVLKKSEVLLSKDALSKILKINHNTAKNGELPILKMDLKAYYLMEELVLSPH